MNKNKVKPKKEYSEKEKATTKTLFVLLFPTIIIAGIGVAYSTVNASIIIVLLAIFQFIMTKQFAESYYKKE